MFIIDSHVLSLINFSCHMADNSMTSTCYTLHHGHMGLSTVSRLTFRSFCFYCARWLTLPWPKRCFFSWTWGPEIEPSPENMPCMSEHNVLSLLLLLLCLLSKNILVGKLASRDVIGVLLGTNTCHVFAVAYQIWTAQLEFQIANPYS